MEPAPSPDLDGPTPPPREDAAAGPEEPARQGSVRSRRGLRQALVVGLFVVALLCLGGGTTAFLFYDKATKPDLSTPALVTRKYLTAYLVEGDDVRAAQFQCGDGSGLKDVRALRDDIDARQKMYNLVITVSIDSVIETSRSGNQADLAADIVLSTTDAGDQLRRVQRWAFAAKNDGGWRVCGGHEVAS